MCRGAVATGATSVGLLPALVCLQLRSSKNRCVHAWRITTAPARHRNVACSGNSSVPNRRMQSQEQAGEHAANSCLATSVADCTRRRPLNRHSATVRGAAHRTLAGRDLNKVSTVKPGALARSCFDSKRFLLSATWSIHLHARLSCACLPLPNADMTRRIPKQASTCRVSFSILTVNMLPHVLHCESKSST